MSDKYTEPAQQAEYLAIKKQIQQEAESQRLEMLAQSNTGESSPTSLRLSPELKSMAKKLAFKRYNKTEISQLLKDLLIKELKKEGLL